jgi:hypothetical protein
MHPDLIQQLALERTARFQRDADRHRLAREAHILPSRPISTAIKLRLSACRVELERLARRRGAVGRATE